MDDYIVEEELGSGGFGTVYLVTRKKDNRKLVAKRMCLDTIPAEEIRKAIDEARTLAAMNHPNICTFEDYFRDRVKTQEYLFIIMEYCEGGSLQSRIVKQHGEPFHLDLIRRWFHSICLALAHVHRRGVIHRDLKPENMFLTKDGVVKVGDFGIAVVATTTLAAGKTKIGTVAYMAPEVLNDSEDEEQCYDYRCDLWSLGVVLYELITLNLPFQAKNPFALRFKICSGKYEPLSNTTPRELRNLVTELLNMDPSKRPPCNEILSRDFFKLEQQSTPTQDSTDDEGQISRGKIRQNLYESTREPEKKMAKALTEAEKKLIKDWEGKWERKKNELGWQSDTMLSYASSEGKTDVATLLIKNGGDVNHTNSLGYSPLHRACANGKTDVIALLIQNGADVNHKTGIGRTPLHTAGKPDIVTLLIENGADVDCQDNDGSTPLYHACFYGRTEVVRVLLRYNANKNINDNRGRTPIGVVCAAASNNQSDAIRRLLYE